MTGRGAESMSEGSDLPVGTSSASTSVPIDDALPTRAGVVGNGGVGGDG